MLITLKRTRVITMLEEVTKIASFLLGEKEANNAKFLAKLLAGRIGNTAPQAVKPLQKQFSQLLAKQDYKGVEGLMNTGGKPFSLATDMRPNSLYSAGAKQLPADAFTDPIKIRAAQLASSVNKKIPTGEPKFDGFNPGTLSNPAAVKAIQQQNIQQALSGRHGNAKIPVQNPFEAIRKRTPIGDQAVEQSFSPDQMWRGFGSKPGLLQSGTGTGAFANRLTERAPVWFSGYPSTAAYYTPEVSSGVTGYLGRFPVQRMSRLGAHSPGFHPENGVDTRFIGDTMHGGPTNPMTRLPTLAGMQKQQVMPSPGANLPNYEATFTNPTGGFAHTLISCISDYRAVTISCR